jgi:hypothetical protein
VQPFALFALNWEPYSPANQVYTVASESVQIYFVNFKYCWFWYIIPDIHIPDMYSDI